MANSIQRTFRRATKRLFDFFLRRYKRGKAHAFQRARIQLILLLFAVLVLPVFLVHNYILFGRVSFAIALTVSTGWFLLLLLLYVLRAGHGLVSGNLFLLLVSGLLWYWMFTGTATPMNRLDTITLVIAAMIMAPLLTNGPGLYLQHALNALLLALFLTYNPAADELAPRVLRSYSLDASIAVLLAAITSHLFLRTSNRIQRETELTNRNLRARVDARTRQLSRARDLVHASREELTRDMNMARNVQLDLLPREMPRVHGWELARYFRPASRVSGDFYDIYTAGRKLRGMALFDVSGHGVGSGLITMLAKSIMLRRFQEGFAGNPARIMETANGELIEELRDVNNYITGVLARCGESRVDIVNAGHCDVLFRPAGESTRPLTRPQRAHKGTVLGLAALRGSYPVMSVDMKVGDMLLIFTDGITESENQAGRQYGEEGLCHALDSIAASDADTVLTSLERHRDNFTGGGPGQDDETMLLLMKK